MLINKNMKNLRSSLERAAKLVVSCKDCTSCCENGLVYLFDEEVPIMKELDVPLVSIKGVNYIQRKNGGSCPMINGHNQGCKIYENRPLCCRLYPLDVFNRNGKLEWGLYTFCPKKNQMFDILVTGEGALNHGVVLQSLQMIENTLGIERLKYLAYEDLVSAEYELLDSFRNDYVILGDVKIPCTELFPYSNIDNTTGTSSFERYYV